MNIVFYFFIYIFETLISYMYFNEKFPQKVNNKTLFVSYTLSFIIQFSSNNIGLPYSNLISFMMCNFLICLICYESKILQALFNSLLLSALMLITELSIIFLTSFIFNTDVKEYTTNDIVLLIQSGISKLFYFLFAYFISRFSTKESRTDLKTFKSSFLFVLPIASITLLLGAFHIAEIYSTDNSIFIIFCIATVLLMYSNIIVFWVHESLIKTQKENTELQLQTQKAEIDTEYYTILQNQYENSNILIHDIKRHLMSIKNLADENDCYSIENYIDNLYNEYEVKNIKQYSNNKLLNAIVNRYATAYTENNIDFYCDIRNINFSFITNNDLTVIVDNLLENALEANQKNDSGKVELFIFPTNVNYITIKLINSCKSAPIIHNGKLITTKTKSSIHGYGLKSIKRIIKKYNGDMSFSFDKSEKLFTTSIILKTI